MLSSPFVDLHYKEKNSKSVSIFQKYIFWRNHVWLYIGQMNEACPAIGPKKERLHEQQTLFSLPDRNGSN